MVCYPKMLKDETYLRLREPCLFSACLTAFLSKTATGQLKAISETSATVVPEWPLTNISCASL